MQVPRPVCPVYYLLLEFVVFERDRSCAVSPMPGKGAGLKVLVQGRQIKAATDFLLSKGVPKKWIEVTETPEKK